MTPPRSISELADWQQMLSAVAAKPLALCPDFPRIADRHERWWSGKLRRPLFLGSAKTSVKIVAVDSGRTLWPQDSTEGYPLNYQTNWMSRGDQINESAARDDLLRNTGMTIARLFYEYASGN